MAKQKPVKVITKIVRGDEIIPYDSLSKEEKIAFGKRLNQRANRAVEAAHGYTLEFIDEPPKTVTA